MNAFGVAYFLSSVSMCDRTCCIIKLLLKLLSKTLEHHVYVVVWHVVDMHALEQLVFSLHGIALVIFVFFITQRLVHLVDALLASDSAVLVHEV